MPFGFIRGLKSTNNKNVPLVVAGDVFGGVFILFPTRCLERDLGRNESVSKGLRSFFIHSGWSDGAKMLGKLQVPWRPTIWITVGQGHTALALGAGGVVWIFLLSSILSYLFLLFFG